VETTAPTKRARLSDSAWLAQVPSLTPDQRATRALALRNSLRLAPLRAAKTEARLLTLELGGSTAPAAAAAWDRVRKLELATR
jgi:hypothetical protein